MATDRVLSEYATAQLVRALEAHGENYPLDLDVLGFISMCAEKSEGRPEPIEDTIKAELILKMIRLARKHRLGRSCDPYRDWCDPEAWRKLPLRDSEQARDLIRVYRNLTDT
jgi:hypothetical protein